MIGKEKKRMILGVNYKNQSRNGKIGKEKRNSRKMNSNKKKLERKKQEKQN